MKETNSGLFQKVIHKISLEIVYLIYTYKKDLALNDDQWLICYKTNPNQRSLAVKK